MDWEHPPHVEELRRSVVTRSLNYNCEHNLLAIIFKASVTM